MIGKISKPKLLNFFFLSSFLFFSSCGDDNKDYLITIHTTYGDMKAILYDETPLHKKNFIKLAIDGEYDSTLFHRVINQFMIQGGDINRLEGKKGRINYTIPAEIKDTLYHHKGALAAARMGDAQNPERASSGSQFYIVHGKQFTKAELKSAADGRNYQAKQKKIGELLAMEKYAALKKEIIDMQRREDLQGLNQFMQSADSLIEQEFGVQDWYQFSPKQLELYQDIGGSPHLDGEYTVFGKVVEGLDVIDQIAMVKTARGDQPIEDVKIAISVEKLPKKQITKRYGYQYQKSAE